MNAPPPVNQKRALKRRYDVNPHVIANDKWLYVKELEVVVQTFFKVKVACGVTHFIP